MFTLYLTWMILGAEAALLVYQIWIIHVLRRDVEYFRDRPRDAEGRFLSFKRFRKGRGV